MLLCLKNASNNLTVYSENYRGLILRSQVSDERMEDLNGLMQIGIQIFESLIFADQRNFAQLALFADNEEFDTNQLKISSACVTWLEISIEINAFVKGLSKVDQLSELSEFQRCLVELEAIVRFAEHDGGNEIPPFILIQRDAALQEHEYGQTQPLIQAE